MKVTGDKFVLVNSKVIINAASTMQDPVTQEPRGRITVKMTPKCSENQA